MPILLHKRTSSQRAIFCNIFVIIFFYYCTNKQNAKEVKMLNFIKAISFEILSLSIFIGSTAYAYTML